MRPVRQIIFEMVEQYIETVAAMSAALSEAEAMKE